MTNIRNLISLLKSKQAEDGSLLLNALDVELLFQVLEAMDKANKFKIKELKEKNK